MTSASSGTDQLLLVMAKIPHPGAVKTRLCPPLLPGLAADLYRAFLRDTLALGTGLARTALGLVYPPVADDHPLRALAPADTLLWPQAGQGLEDGLSGAFAQAFAHGYQRVVIVSSDSPTLPQAIIIEAFDRLADHDLVLGPTDDGGYYLIGLTRPERHLFTGIAWSTEVVYEQTVERAAERHLRVHATPRWHDVDTAADLPLLAQHCASGAAPQTALLLRESVMQRLLQEQGMPLPATVPAASQPWQMLDSTTLLESPWRIFRVDRVRLQSGQEITYSYGDVPGAAWVVPLTNNGEIVLIRQYRYPVRRWVWEVPAGAIGDETPLAAARRELAEEIGGCCRELRAVGRFLSSSAHLTLEAHVFLATGVELGATTHEATEMIAHVALPAEEVFARARSGAIDEGQSALAILMAEPLIRALGGDYEQTAAS